LPLKAELEALARRDYADVVIVDDVHAFGRESLLRGWGEVTLEWIGDHFPGKREATVIIDCAVIYR
jgi:hypothetical protein